MVWFHHRFPGLHFNFLLSKPFICHVFSKTEFYLQRFNLNSTFIFGKMFISNVFISVSISVQINCNKIICFIQQFRGHFFQTKRISLKPSKLPKYSCSKEMDRITSKSTNFPVAIISHN